MEPLESPPPMEFFARRRPAAGGRRVVFAFGRIRIELRGVGDTLFSRLGDRFAAFVRPADEHSASLAVDVEQAGRDYFVEPPPRAEANRLVLRCDGDRVRLLGYTMAGWFPVDGGRGQLVLAAGSYEPVERSAENYIRAAVAWLAATGGGALVHAASAVREGRGYLFYGESGAGKSTLSACSRSGRVVSDDLSLVLPGSDGRLQLVGTPFRGTYEKGEPVLESFPLAAGFRIVQDTRAAVRTVPRPRAFAELVGNLPFVAEAFDRRPDLFDGVERAFREIPLAHLHFRKDDSYWEAITQARL